MEGIERKVRYYAGLIIQRLTIRKIEEKGDKKIIITKTSERMIKIIPLFNKLVGKSK